MNIRRSLGNAVGMLMIVVVTAGGTTAASVGTEAGGLPGVTSTSTSAGRGLPGKASAETQVSSAPETGQRAAASRGLPG